MPARIDAAYWDEMAAKVRAAEGGWVVVRVDPAYRRGGRLASAEQALARRGLAVEVVSERDADRPHNWLVMARLLP